jgi:transposase
VAQRFVHKRTGVVVTAPFPPDVKGRFRFGVNVQCKVVHDRIRLCAPYEKVVEDLNFFADLGMSKSTAVNIYNKAAKAQVILDYIEGARRYLVQQYIVYCDETGTNVDGKTAWAHYIGNEFCTLITISMSRGIEGITGGRVLQFCHSIMMSDRWPAYRNEIFDCDHATCNVHIRRDLVPAIQTGNKWADKMDAHVMELKTLSDDNGGRIPSEKDDWARRKYARIINQGYAETGGRELPKEPGKRGRQKRTPERNLLEFLDYFREDVLRFAFDECVPFSNNLAESSIRPYKNHDKISGTFKNLVTAQNHANLMGYEVTCRLNGMTSRDAITALLTGKTPDFILEWLKLPPVEE